MQQAAVMHKKGPENWQVKQSQLPALLPVRSRRLASQQEMRLVQLLG